MVIRMRAAMGGSNAERGGGQWKSAREPRVSGAHRGVGGAIFVAGTAAGRACGRALAAVVTDNEGAEAWRRGETRLRW